MVIDKLLKEGVALMEGLEYSNPILESILVLSHLLGVDKIYIYTHGDREVSQKISREFIELMKKRSKGYPLAYILGKKEFMGLDFYIKEGVLIPRPDTEILVEYLIDRIRKDHGEREVRLLELGLGSGAISLSTAYYCKNVEAYAIDIDPRAVEVSTINKEKLGLERVHIYQADIFQGLDFLDGDKNFDFIISNPPYIRSKDIEKLQKDVRDFEPLKALDGGRDGLDFYREISRKSRDYLSENGLLLYEIGYNQGKDVREILLGEGFSHIVLKKDLQGHDRVIGGSFKPERRR